MYLSTKIEVKSKYSTKRDPHNIITPDIYICHKSLPSASNRNTYICAHIKIVGIRRGKSRLKLGFFSVLISLSRWI